MNTLHYCDTYLKQFQAEHHHLNSAVLEIRHTLEGFQPSGEAEAQQNSLTDRLERLLTQLQGL
jgi:hypothetical protein